MSAMSPRVAPDDSPDSLEAANQQAVLFHSLNEVVAARRFESTHWPQQRAEQSLVDPDHPDGSDSREANYEA
tara:strand:+ start:134 stop:349 length:216 start_codon:yes stop_codon:yes gene_type:complete